MPCHQAVGVVFEFQSNGNNGGDLPLPSHYLTLAISIVQPGAQFTLSGVENTLERDPASDPSCTGYYPARPSAHFSPGYALLPTMNVIRQCKEREISRVIDPTVLAFAPLLKKKKAFIKEIPVKTFRYGSGNRGELDIYYPLTSQHQSFKTPVLFYIYGGGFNTGEKSISPKTFGLVYANVAAYFARRGFVVVIPDYRLVPHVTFPGPAEDIRDALRWVIQNDHSLVSDGSPHPDIDEIIMMGHSAGAAHIATMLFLPDVLPKDDPLRERIKVAILESPPFDLSAMTMEWPTADVHAKYWVTLEKAKEEDPLHLYRRLDKEFTLEKLPRLLMVEGEFEPEWLINAGKVFHKEVEEKTGEDLRIVVAKGHNHVSLNWALSTGEGEEWAEEVIEWLKAVKEAN